MSNKARSVLARLRALAGSSSRVIFIVATDDVAQLEAALTQEGAFHDDIRGGADENVVRQYTTPDLVVNITNISISKGLLA